MKVMTTARILAGPMRDTGRSLQGHKNLSPRPGSDFVKTRLGDRLKPLPMPSRSLLKKFSILGAKSTSYRKGSNAVNPDFDLWSAGKDGITKTTTSAADMNSEDMRDDIKNF